MKILKRDINGQELIEGAIYLEINWDIIPISQVFEYLGLDYRYHGVLDCKNNLRALGIRFTQIGGY